MSKTSARPTITPGRRFFFAPTFFFSGSFAGSEKFSAKSKNSLRCWTRIERKCASQYLGIFLRVCRCVLAAGAGGRAVWLWLSLWAVCTHSKFCFSAWFLAFFALQVVFVFVPLARFWDFRKCFHAHKWAGACFSLYDIGQTGATSRPLSDCAPISGRDTRTACPRWKPYSAPADGTQHAREYPQAPARLKVCSRSLY